jgi:hypothetical protein
MTLVRLPLFLSGSLPALAPVQPPVLHRFGDMDAGHTRAAGQVGDGARHFQYAMISARGKIQAADGLLEQVFPLGIRGAVLVYACHRQMGVGFCPVVAVAADGPPPPAVARRCPVRLFAGASNPAAARQALRSGCRYGPATDRKFSHDKGFLMAGPSSRLTRC